MLLMPRLPHVGKSDWAYSVSQSSSGNISRKLELYVISCGPTEELEPLLT